MYKYFCFLLMLLTASLFGQSSTETKASTLILDTVSIQSPLLVDDASIEKYKEDTDFVYTEDELKESKWTQFKNWLSRVWRRIISFIFGDIEGGAFLYFLINILPYIIVTALLAFIIWLFYKLNPGASLFTPKKKPEVYLTEEEEIIKTKDIGKLLEKALLNKEYRLAIRYSYLEVIKLLTEAQIIDYEANKTNKEYLNEIQENLLKKDFQQVTFIYNHSWYGKFPISVETYQKAEIIFSSFKKIIPPQHG